MRSTSRVVVLVAGVVLPRPGASEAFAEVSGVGSTQGRPLAPGGGWALVASRECPARMVPVGGHEHAFCVDRYEAMLLHVQADGETSPWPGNQPIDGLEESMMAVSRPGVKPQGYISGKQASVACANAGKRLCSSEEWTQACRGPRDTRYPYGERRRAGVCNDRFKELVDHPVLRLFQAVAERGADPRSMWQPAFMNDSRLHELPRTVSPTGAFGDCTNDYGAFDMVGNLHEWIADPRGVFAGGYFMDTYQNGEGCEYRTRAHRFDYHDYSTGFRCCVDAGSSEFGTTGE
jgi:sulfatase modifying factor 1